MVCFPYCVLRSPVGSVAEDNENQKLLTCFTPDGSTDTNCLLKVYSEKKAYNYTRQVATVILHLNNTRRSR